ncbi:hypothetical protein [Bartonella elizabethae]|uniref:hypothetical protein n=1 Tax=Bartonella elizabethae TaxID=807 RepID=UPI0002F9AEC2|nr:hypothetical protein [Bartonella elizabethae]
MQQLIKIIPAGKNNLPCRQGIPSPESSAKSGLSHRAALSQEERALVFTRAGAFSEQRFTKEQPWLQWGQDQPLNK